MPIPAACDLAGRVAVVTGAGSPDGIGFATARLLAELGAAVMIGATTARVQDRVSELRRAGFDVAGVTGDLTDPGAAQNLVSAALGQWGRLDIVVNNAGMISTADPVFESGTADAMSLPTWQASLSRNLTTAFLVTKAALPDSKTGSAVEIMPALLTTMSSRPHCPSAADTRFCAAPGSVRSPVTPATSNPARRSSLTLSWTRAVVAPIITAAPSSASSRAVAKPIPSGLPAPVTTATRPARSNAAGMGIPRS